MKYAVPLLLLAACADPVVDMQLVAPSNATQLDTSCVASVEVHLDGPNFQTDKSDTRMSCVQLDSSAPTYGKLLDAIRGKFQLGMPDGGLADVEVYGFAGPCKREQGDPTTPDLIFFATQQYVGDDLIEMQLVPNLDCKPSPVAIHLVDLMTLVSGANPTEANCTAAAVPDGPGNGAGVDTVMPQLAGKGLDVYGGRSGAASHNSVASFSGLTSIGPKSCLASGGGSATASSLSCVSPTPSLCASAGEIEAPLLNDDVYAASIQPDSNSVRFQAAIVASVWTGTTGKHPASGATIDVDPSQGVIEYVDPPAAGSNKLVPRSASSTGGSGLFVLFTNTLASVKITYNGKTTPVTMGGYPGGTASAIYVVN
ncbi:MAG: hypothetical protein ACM31C_25885 [Acidobacteriota bacterium]